MKTIVRIVYYGYGESNTYIALYEYLKKKHDDLITQDAYHFSCSQGNFELLSGRDQTNFIKRSSRYGLCSFC